jgi:glycine/D-amino acid oxidase-like deaminating enzyme
LGRGKLLQETGIPATGGIRSAGWALIDPYRACLGIAAAAVARGADFFERSPMKGIRPGRLGVEIRTDAGIVEARTVVIATGGPPPPFKALARHFKRRASYAVLTGPVAPGLRRQLGSSESVLRDSASPPHVVTWSSDRRLFASGADQPAVPAARRARVLVQRGGQIMYETSLLYPAISGIQPEYVWDIPVVTTADGLMYAGPHRNYPRHLFALGCGHDGPASAFLAARILLRHYQQAPEREDEAFGFGR